MLLPIGFVAAQESPQDSCVATAEVLASTHHYPEALRLLENHLASQPGDVAATRTLARLSYWSGDIGSADSLYARGVSRFPDDPETRIEFGRFLLERGQYDRAEDILEPLAALRNADAEALLGTAAYWQGDWGAAVVHYGRALALRPGQAEALQRLREIRSITSPLVSVSPEYQSDNQPIRRLGAGVDAAMHITPLLRLALGAGSSQITALNTTLSFDHASLSLANTWGKAGIRLEGEAGISRLESRNSPEADWKVTLSKRISEFFLVSGFVERAPYFETSSSFSSEVTTTTGGVTLERAGAHTWIGRASYQRKRFNDGNVGLQAFGWFLSSPGPSNGITVQVGYGFSFQDTREDRYILPAGSSPVYAPYYTPLQQMAHSALLLLNIPFSSSVTMRVNGSYGVYASELAPGYSRVTTGPPGLGGSSIVKSFQRRTYSPWQVRCSLDAALSPVVHLHIDLSRQESAYYQVSLISAGLSYTFLSEPSEGVAR